ncbi:hypothetical protein [Phocaeicola sartorii]|jgi:PBP1b-binding outer membrane lipoprotein LpoB|uniref:Lipoprotein n=1 Tax=Phocaeicola sartorii TaxID=671267 RepID=R9IBZ8_9BACT|nr:hypothetical protein [Phocaeicola sartorii]EOS15046.1 hypothetical protein C802_01063 [Phocaeicola sartorii]MCR1847520.1 hypothetical protein [Phocaeicola sartorii]NUL01167.1 hypothetical protein [Phocaeicola sartorii]
MKMIKLIFVFIFLLSGCMSNHTSKSCLNESDGLYLLSQDKGLLNLTPVTEYFPDGFSGYIYVMNSECSDCIGTFISFVKKLSASRYCGNLLVVISVATQPVVNHYIKEYDFSKNINVILSEDKQGKWGIGSIEKENGKVYVVTDNKIENVFQYALY